MTVPFQCSVKSVCRLRCFHSIFSCRLGNSQLKERTRPSDNIVCRFIQSVVLVSNIILDTFCTFVSVRLSHRMPEPVDWLYGEETCL